jgi:hypothetical protein
MTTLWPFVSSSSPAHPSRRSLTSIPGGAQQRPAGSAASLEFDDRPGAVRDAVARALRRWLRVLEDAVATAQAQGEVDHDPGAVRASRVAGERLLANSTAAACGT